MNLQKQLSFSLAIIIIFSSVFIAESQVYPEATSVVKRLESFQNINDETNQSIFQNLNFRSVGPTICSGRVADISVNPDNPAEFYVAYASGGLWKTTNNGQSFTPVFENEATMTIGDVEVDWKHGETIWIGTGEANAFLFAGLGIYKSIDKGKTWKHLGLTETTHISEIIIHPENPDTVWVSSPGHLWSTNKQRGVFKTTDGGKNWKKVLFIDEMTGITDMKQSPNNPDIIYAAAWQRMRRPWRRIKSGESSGIYKSIDGGENWKLITKKESGFPFGEGVGRIGLAISKSNPKVVYALLDNQFKREREETKGLKITKDELKEMSKGKFLALDEKLISNYCKQYNFPSKYTVKKLKEMVGNDEIKPADLVAFIEDPNRAMFEDLPIIGAEVYRSNDGGKSWKRTNIDYIDDLFFSYGYVFDVIRVSPVNPDKIYIGGVFLLTSDDGGKTFHRICKENVHLDHHALWTNPQNEGHLINGNDGGVNISYDDGETWFKANSIPVSQFYTVNFDMDTPYNIYGGMQDNGVWYAPNNYKYSRSWHQYGEYTYKEIHGGDGMVVQIDTRDNNIVYTGSQYGNYSRYDKTLKSFKRIKPKHELGERPLRFNWQTPIHLSVHNQDIIYCGSNKFHRSLNRGDNFETLSGDLTKGGKPGDVQYGTLSAIHESPFKFGLIYTGADDGSVHVSKDGGNSWTDISNGLPEGFWVNNIQASSHKLERVYISLNGYRWDNSTPYIFVSDNMGTTWQQIGTNLPTECVFVAKEDPLNPDLIYAGTQNGLFISMDRGKTFMKAGTETLPNVAIFDLAVHPRENDLIVATHGRSLFVADISQLQKLTPEISAKEIFVFDINPVRYSTAWGQKWGKWQDAYTPEINIPVYINSEAKVKVRILSPKALELNVFEAKCKKGINSISYNLKLNNKKVNKYREELNENNHQIVKRSKDGNFYLTQGEYTIEIEVNGKKVSNTLVIN